MSHLTNKVRTLTNDWRSLKKWSKIWPRNKCIDIVKCLGWRALTSCVMIVLVGEQRGRWRGRWMWSWISARLYWSAQYLQTVKWFLYAHCSSKHEEQNVLNLGLVLIQVQGSLGCQDMIQCSTGIIASVVARALSCIARACMGWGMRM